MCDPISMAIVGGVAGNIAGWGTLGLTVLGAVGGAAAGQAGKKFMEGMQPPQLPSVPSLPTPPQTPQTQAAQSPTSTAFRARNRQAAAPGGPLAGFGSTLLTGPGGANPLSGNLGTSTLLGQ